MHYRLKLMAFIICLMPAMCLAQLDDRFAEADSLTWKLYEAGDWQQLLTEGKTLISQHTDFKNLRLRMGYAALMTENYSEAISQYDEVLRLDSYNQIARYYSSVCQGYLGRESAAMYHVNYITTGALNKDSLPKAAFIGLSLESSYKRPTYNLRGDGWYYRLGVNLRLGWHVLLEQDVSYFGQQIYSTATTPAGPGAGATTTTSSPSTQAEYFGKLHFTPAQNLTLWGAYHFLATTQNNTNSLSHIGFIGFKFYTPFVTLQADADMGTLTGSHIAQYNAGLAFYPFGNLNLYSFTRGSYKNSGDLVLNELLGVKLVEKLWLEGAASVGPLDNFIEADGLYVYNSIDPSSFKGTVGLLYSLGLKTYLSIYYTYEKKQDSNQTTNFNQHSITGGISWKF